MTDQVELVEVIQADRDAAADLATKRGDHARYVGRVRTGLHDHHVSVQALARHRIDATGREAVLEEALRDIQQMTDPDDEDNYRADDREGCFDTVFETAKRALSSTPPIEGGEGHG